MEVTPPPYPLALLEEYGTLSWPEVLAPAIEYAEKGFVVTPKFHQAFGRDDIKIGHFPYGAQLFYHDGEPWPVGHVLKQPDLAMTFRAIAEGGPEVFYGGAIAERFVEYFAETAVSLPSRTSPTIAPVGRSLLR